MNVLHQIQSTAYLSTKHQSHIESRGLLNNWSWANCRTVTADEASVYLGYTAKSGGILFLGKTTQFQFRPDKPWKSSGCKKAPKYRTPLGEYDAFLPLHPTDKDYWDPEKLKLVCYHINDHPYLIITEGAFKAIAGCSHDLPTIGLMGTSMGLTAKKSDLQNKRYLVPTLELYARAGFGFIIGFDADAATNPSVIWEQRKLGHQLLKFSVPVYSITGAWDAGTEGETKGMDDFIQRKGIEEFRRMLARSVRFEDWESSLGDDSPPQILPQTTAPAIFGSRIRRGFARSTLLLRRTQILDEIRTPPQRSLGGGERRLRAERDRQYVSDEGSRTQQRLLRQRSGFAQKKIVRARLERTTLKRTAAL